MTTKFDDEIESEIVVLLEQGAYQSTAAHRVGVNPRTLRRWLQRGRSAWDSEADGGEVEDTERPYLAFAQRCEAAIATAEVDLMARLREAPAGQWQKWMTIMERRWPDHWSLQQRQHLVVESEGPTGEPPREIFGDETDPVRLARIARSIA
jgi:hypothetical protein